jgi:hypothetical protein
VRIRQVRPEFFTDPVTAHLPTDVRLTYIGLWCVADDAGYLVWDVRQIGALLFPYSPPRARERRIEKAGAALVEAKRLELYACGCGRIPTLPNHQKIGGTKSVTVAEKHRVHTNMDESARNVRVGNVRERGGTGGIQEESDRIARIDAWRRQGLPVDVVS